MAINRKKYVIQESGQVTLPIEFRRKFGLNPGDEIMFEETDSGLLISTKEMILRRLLDEIGQALREKGVTLEDLIESGREIRGEIIKEKYGLDANDD